MATYDVQASYPAAATSTSGKPRTITTLVLPAGSRAGTKKTMTFKRRDDFTISLDYKDVVAPYVAKVIHRGFVLNVSFFFFCYSGFPQRILEADITGVSEAMANLTEIGVVDPVVKATVTLSESGFVSVMDAVAYGEIKDDSLTGMYPSAMSTSFEIVIDMRAPRKTEGTVWGRQQLGRPSTDQGRRRLYLTRYARVGICIFKF
jgi:hypoxia up-regulated 1